MRKLRQRTWFANTQLDQNCVRKVRPVAVHIDSVCVMESCAWVIVQCSWLLESQPWYTPLRGKDGQQLRMLALHVTTNRGLPIHAFLDGHLWAAARSLHTHAEDWICER